MTGIDLERPPGASARSLVALSAVAALLAVVTACVPYEPLPRQQTFVFQGAHATLGCAECHGGGPPYYAFVWDTTCLTCHEADRALHPGAHNVGLGCAANAGCHAEADLLWSDALNGGTAVDHDFLPLEGGHITPGGCSDCHGDGAPSAGNVVPEDATPELCWSCHEDDRYFPTHYVYTDADGLPPGAELRRDCKACHDVTARTGGTFGADWGVGYGLHGNIRFPHGLEDDGEPQSDFGWVVDCADCHPSGPPAYECTVACHDEIFDDPIIPQHAPYAPGENDGVCTGCHIYGDIRQP